MYTTGVDIASFQGLPDWRQVHKEGYRFAYVKTTQWPHYVNPDAGRQRVGAFQAGFTVGNYCYAVAKYGDPVGQAQFFLSRSGIQPWHLVPFLDLEEAGSEGVSPKHLEQFAYEWAVQVTGFLGIKKVVLYTDLNMLRNRVLVTPRLRRLFLLDLADWTLGPPPKVPGWDLAFHQFDTSHGVPGFDGPVDRMRALIPLSELTIAAMRQANPSKAPVVEVTGNLAKLRARLRI